MPQCVLIDLKQFDLLSLQIILDFSDRVVIKSAFKFRPHELDFSFESVFFTLTLAELFRLLTHVMARIIFLLHPFPSFLLNSFKLDFHLTNDH